MRAVDPGNLSAMPRDPSTYSHLTFQLGRISKIGTMRPFFLGYRYQVSGFGEISGTCPAGADAGVEHGTLGGGAGGPFFDSVYLVHREFELSS